LQLFTALKGIINDLKNHPDYWHRMALNAIQSSLNHIQKEVILSMLLEREENAEKAYEVWALKRSFGVKHVESLLKEAEAKADLALLTVLVRQMRFLI